MESAPIITTQLLESAYRQGVFPMGDPQSGELSWYQPDPRAIFDLEQFHVPRRLAKTVRSDKFAFSIDRDFAAVIRHCSRIDQDNDGIWISDDILDLYERMFQEGKAHSVEVWHKGELVGGLYGVALGGAFMGESMFHTERDASKAALVFLVEHLRNRGYVLLDTQFATDHLAQFGIVMIPHSQYMLRLHDALALEKVSFNCATSGRA